MCRRPVDVGHMVTSRSKPAVFLATSSCKWRAPTAHRVAGRIAAVDQALVLTMPLCTTDPEPSLLRGVITWSTYGARALNSSPSAHCTV